MNETERVGAFAVFYPARDTHLRSFLRFSYPFIAAAPSLSSEGPSSHRVSFPAKLFQPQGHLEPYLDIGRGRAFLHLFGAINFVFFKK